MNTELTIILIIFILLIVIFTDTKEDYSSSLESSNNIKRIKQKILNNNNFDIYIIHIKTNKERLINFDNYYNISDISFKKYNIFPAVIGKDLDLVNFVTPFTYKQMMETERTKKRKYHYELSRGAVGCYLSHISIYKKIADSNVDYGIVFEDDCIVTNDFYQRLQYGLSVIPDNWDIFLLGLMCIKCDINKEYMKIDRFWGTHSYIIRKKSAAKILQYLDRPLSKQIDADLSLLIKKKVINIYAINPVIAMQDGVFQSDIQLDIETNPESFNEDFKQHALNYHNKTR
jgi:GR25 family glycosyltransferase involved in LPS biosynthesis